MKTPFLRTGRLAVVCVVLGLPVSLRAGSFSANFDDGQAPSGTTVFGNAVVEDTGGFASGALKVVKNLPGQQGSWVIEDLDGGEQVNGFDVTFKARVGGGTIPPADGWSFSFASDLPDGAWSEEGIGTGLTVAFDLYDNGNAEAPAITIKWADVVIAEVKPPISEMITGEAGTPLWADVQIKLSPDGSLDVVFDGVTYFANLYTPFVPIAGGRFGIGGRTGGANANVFIDNFSLETTTGGLQAAIVHQPQSSTFLPGSRARFYALLANDDVATGFRWERKEPGAASFLPIADASSRDFVSAAPVGPADNGAQYRLIISDGDGETVSDEVTLTVSALPAPAPDYTQNFDSGVLPGAEGTLFGTAIIDPTGFLRLTDLLEGESGAAVFNDIDAGASISAIFVAFDLRLGTGTVPPADGFSFNWATDLPAGPAPVAEEGVGSGLRLSFDVYDSADGNPLNGMGEAPTLDLKWGETVLASVRTSPWEFFTDAEFVPVLVRLEPSGLVSVAFNGRLYFQNIQVPNWSAVAGAQFGFYARTGGLSQQYEIDNVAVTTTTYAGPVQITGEPDDLLGVTGEPAQFAVSANYAIPPAAVQWEKRAPGAAGFSDIAGANAFTLVTAPLTNADNGSLYRVRVTVGASTATSREALLTVVDFTAPALSDIVLNFDSGGLTNTGTVAGAAISAVGSAAFIGAGGVGDSGYLSLTDATASQSGALVIESFSTVAQGALIATFDVNLTGSGTSIPTIPADGFSFNWAEDVPAGTLGLAEEGAGTGLSITFDSYDNTDANPDNPGGEAPAIGIRYRGAFVVPELRVPRAFLQPLDWTKVGIRVDNDGTVDVLFNNVVVFNNVALPGWSGLANGRFNLAGRTGGAVSTHWVDNVVIDVANYIGPLVFTQQPGNRGVLAGSAATFSARVNDPGQASWKWQSAPAGSDAFTDIPGATTDTYTTDPTTLADNGRQFKAIATGAAGPVPSTAAILTVFDPVLPPPTAELDFDSATDLTYGFGGMAIEDMGQGIDGSGYASLTIAAEGQNGVLVIDDFNAGAPVSSMYAAWQMRIGGGTATPADGVAFVWGDDVGTSDSPVVFGEEGSGNGLIVSFDTYENNSVTDVPGISLKWQGSLLAERPMPAANFLSDPDYFPVVVKLDADGTADVWFNNEVIFYDVSLPGWNALSGASFAWGGRTGGSNQNSFIDAIQIRTTLAPPVTTDTLSLNVIGGNLVLTYTGILQSSLNLATGSWQTVAGAASPYTIPLPTSGQLFFRTAR